MIRQALVTLTDLAQNVFGVEIWLPRDRERIQCAVCASPMGCWCDSIVRGPVAIPWWVGAPRP
jgi:hypothetical protein